MDSFNSGVSDQDDFEFKPLTEGLGFHQKKNQTPAKPLVQFKNEMPELEINSPLPRAKKNLIQEPNKVSAKAPIQKPQTNTVDEILKTLNEKRNIDFSKSKEKIKAQQQAPIIFKPAAWDLSASLLDAMLVVAASLLCLILLLVITHIDLFANIYHPDAAGMVYWSLIALVAAVSWIYLVGHRVFLGFTPGEWVFDQRLGRPEEITSLSYLMKTVLRSTLAITTGFIAFPILSFAMNDDLLGKLVGLRLMKRA